MSTDDEKKLVEMYKKGWSVRNLGFKFGITVDRVRTILVEYHIPLRK